MSVNIDIQPAGTLEVTVTSADIELTVPPPVEIELIASGPPGPAGSGSGGGGVTVHADLTGRSAVDSHPISAITSLSTTLSGKSDTSHTHTLDNLSDVNTSGATSGQTLVFGGAAWTPGTVSGGGGHAIHDEGNALTSRATLNFTGAGVTVTDNAGATRTDVTIPGSGSALVVDWLNAKDYGATGDGVTNDTTALQNCINAAATQGKIAYLPYGRYKVTTSSKTVNGVTAVYGLNLPAGTRLVGDGPGPRTWMSQDGGEVFGLANLAAAATQPAEFTGNTEIFTASTTGSILLSINTRRVSIERLAVYGPGKTGNTVNAIRFGYVTVASQATQSNTGNSVPFYINATDVWVSNCGGDGFLNQTTCVSSWRNCIASEIGGTGFNHPEGSTSCTYISCWARSCKVGWFFYGCVYCNLSGCAADYCNTSYWVRNSQSIGFFGCGSEFPIDLTPGGAVGADNRGYSWRFDKGPAVEAGGSNTCMLSACEVIGNPHRAIWLTEGANQITLIGVADNGPMAPAQWFLVADADTAANLVNVRLTSLNLIDAAALITNLDHDFSVRDVNVKRDVVLSTGNLFLKNTVTDGKTGTLPFFNAGGAVIPSKVTYNDGGTGGITAGEMLVTTLVPGVPGSLTSKDYVDKRTPTIIKSTTAPTDTTAIWVDINP